MKKNRDADELWEKLKSNPRRVGWRVSVVYRPRSRNSKKLLPEFTGENSDKNVLAGSAEFSKFRFTSSDYVAQPV